MRLLSLCLFMSVTGVLAAHYPAALADDSLTVEREIEVAQLKRTYRIHVPANVTTPAAPLVMMFHGGGGNARQIERFTRFSELADRAGFIVVYPQGIGNNWNDGREASNLKSQRDNVDDVRFVAAMLDEIADAYRVDPKRIYATGISNGAIFSHYLAAHLSARIAAIAPVVGGIADPFHRRFKPSDPVSVVILQGTEDPLVPYAGGEVVAGGNRGKVISTVKTANMWVTHDGCAGEPQVETLPDKNADDHCRIKSSTWSKCRAGTEVVLYTLEGAGHTWPGGTQYLPQRFVGRVCRDIDATEAIWEFFRAHPRQ
jgi:polyhydroxybutyrate depolymerase